MKVFASLASAAARGIVVVFPLALAWMSTAANAQTTYFTYQGQLSDAEELANGNYDLSFALFDAATDGTQIGATQIVETVAVSNGIFTAELDFGVNAFPGANRFVEVAVKPAGGGSYTTLAPRQQISSSPYAIRTLSAATADALSSACTACVTNVQIQGIAGTKVSGTIPAASVPSGSGNYVQNTTAPQANSNFNISGNGVVGGNLTVTGTLNANVSGNFIQNRTTPQAGASFNVSGNGTVGETLSAGKVEIAAQDGLRISGFQPFLTLRDTNAGGKTGFVQSASGDTLLVTDSRAALVLKDVTGNVGIGTATPQTKLQIAGGSQWTSNGWTAGFALGNATALGWAPNASGQRFGIGQSGGGLYFFRTNAAFGSTASASIFDMVIGDNGNVGIGTITPTSAKLQANGGAAFSGVHAITAGSNVPGVYGGSSGSEGTGIVGEANNGQFAYGVWGKSTGGQGVRGTSATGYGVYSDGRMLVRIPTTDGEPLRLEGATGKYASFVFSFASSVGGGDIGDFGIRTSRNSQTLAWLDEEAEWNASSDRKLKTDIEPLHDVLAAVRQLPIRTYRLKGSSGGALSIGVVAQEVEPLFPSLVSVWADGETEEVTLGVSYSKLGVVALKAIQEQQSLIDAQAARIARLEARDQRPRAEERRINLVDTENRALRRQIEAQRRALNALEDRLANLERTATANAINVAGGESVGIALKAQAH